MAPPSTRIRTTVLAVVAILACAAPAQAGFAITGNPGTDLGWGSSVGNSLANGKYIRGDGNFSFDMYRAEFLAGLLDGFTGLGGMTDWQPADTVFAMGGVIVETESDFFGADTAPVNANLIGSVRIVSKFTNSGGGFSPSYVAPGSGGGHGNFSAGDGGNGSILIATVTTTGTTTQQVTPGGAGMLTLAGINQRYDDSVTPLTPVSDISDKNARFIYKYADGKLASWEVLLNTSRLSRNLPSNTIVPEWAGRWDQALQRGTKKFTDGLNLAPISIEPSARRAFLASDLDGEPEPPALATPLPPTLVALAIGGGLLGLGRRLRRAA